MRYMNLRRMLSDVVGRVVAKFSSPEPMPIDQMFWEMAGRSTRSVSRAEALAVPAVLRGRNYLCHISTLPLVQTNALGVVQRNPLLEQIDRDVANVVTLAQTVEDLVFESVAWWLITERDQDRFPTKARHIDPSQVSLDPPMGSHQQPLPSNLDPRGIPFVYVEGVRTPATDVIRFDSPCPPLLIAGRKAIRRAILLDAAASMYAEDPRPLDYFTPADGADDPDDAEVKKILAQWRSSRKRRATAWVPAWMKYNSVDTPSPQQMQLVELQQRAALEIANAIGVDPEDLGISTTTRTYANINDRRQDKVNETLSPYMLAITQRLSMGDVTRRGHSIRFDLGDYMKANPVDRAAIDVQYYDRKAMTKDELRAGRNLPPLTDAQRAELEPKPAPTPPPVDPAAEVENIDAIAEEWRRMQMTRPTRLRMDAKGSNVFTVDFNAIRTDFRVERETRTIWGLAIPYGQIVEKYGYRFRFMNNSIEWSSQVSRVKFLRDHDFTRAVGYALDLTQTQQGVLGKYKLGRSRMADEALMDAEDGVTDGLSASVVFDLAADAKWNDADKVYDVYRARMDETSLTAMPAFDDARVTKVAASRNTGGGNRAVDECTTCGQRHAPGVACTPQPQNPPANQPAAQGVRLTDEQMRVIFSQPGALQALMTAASQPAQPAQPEGALVLSAEQVTAMAQSGALATLLGLPGVMRPAPQPQPAPEGPTLVDPTRRPVAVTATREEQPYRFDRGGRLTNGRFDFSTDVIAGLRDKNEEALQRATDFMMAQFDIANVEDTTDVASLNPSRQRPDLYVDQKAFIYPFYTFCNKGTLADNTPFIFPIFSSSSGLVGAHTEGTEPTGGEYKTSSTTVTPSALSGKAEITREVWDAGGNPRVSDLVWRAMLRGWFEGLEAAVVTMLNATTLTSQTITLTAGATDTDLTGELEGNLAMLNFARGGFTMRDLFLQADLYKALRGAMDATGRPLYPIIGANNASGTAGPLWGSLDIGGVAGRPSWALAAAGQTSATPSYLLDEEAVSFWASAPNRLTFEYQVKSVNIGIWGYKAGVVNDVTGVRKVNWDPTA